jgi:regulator of protease activity HflC (stomatin/prohibitin superfamily)
VAGIGAGEAEEVVGPEEEMVGPEEEMGPGRADSVRVSELGGCAKIVGRQGSMLAQARQARLAAEAEQAAAERAAAERAAAERAARTPAEAPSRRFRLRWRLLFPRAAH